MQIVIDITEHEWEYLNKLVMNEEIIGHYERLLVNGIPLPKENKRKFEEIVVEYPPTDLCTYPEYKGKPYYSIKYEENGEHFIGYGTYNPKVFSRYLRDYFIVQTRRSEGENYYETNS